MTREHPSDVANAGMNVCVFGLIFGAVPAVALFLYLFPPTDQPGTVQVGVTRGTIVCDKPPYMNLPRMGPYLWSAMSPAERQQVLDHCRKQ